MIDKLKNLLPNFLGRQGHVRCMAHMVNLSAKGILCPFEVKKQTKKKENSNDNKSTADDDNDDKAELSELLVGLDIEELHAEMQDLEENGECARDNEDGLVNVFEQMTITEKRSWANTVVPLRSALVKVNHSLT